MRLLSRLSIILFAGFIATSRSHAAEGDVVKITFNGASASVSIPTTITNMVKADVDGAFVTITSATTTEEYIYDVSGSTTNGGLVINGNYKLTLQLSGVDIHNRNGAAIDVECGKRIAVKLADGTENVLSDSENGIQKSALYFSGHPEFDGSGSLTVTGNTKHAISAKEYLQIKKTFGGVINVLSAVSDGIHCGKGKVNNENNYFQMSAGTINISGVGGDCIDSDDFGTMTIKGGNLNLTVSDGNRGLKCDSIFTMEGGHIDMNVTGVDADGIRSCYTANFLGGTLNLTVAGNGSKGIKAKEGDATVLNGGSALFAGTDIDIAVKGSDYADPLSGEVSKCMGISVDKDMTQTAGDIKVYLESEKGKSYNVKGELVRTGGTFTTIGSVFSVNPADFQYDMTAYVLAAVDGNVIDDYSHYQMAALNEDACCGVATFNSVGNYTYGYLRIYSNETAAPVSFSMYDMMEGRYYKSEDVVTFSSDATVGRPSAPMIVNMIPQLTQEEEDFILSVTDVTEYPYAIYSIEGIRLPALQRGVNILHMSNGTVRKVFVK